MKSLRIVLTLLCECLVSGLVSAQTLLPVSSLGRNTPFHAFIESRDCPVQFNDSVRAFWMDTSPQLKASIGEIYCFQIVLCAASDLSDVRLDFHDFKNGGSRIKSSAVTCFNTDGVDIYGQPFHKDISVRQGHVQPLWVGIDLTDAVPGRYIGTAAIEAAGHKQKLEIEIDVDDRHVDNHGYNEGWRMSRLNWLNSTIAQDNNVTKGYEPVTRDGNVISILGRKVTVGPDGLPSSINSYFTGSNQSVSEKGAPILSAPMEFIIETSQGREVMKPSDITFRQEGEGCLTWTISSKSKNIELLTSAKMEFDGFVRYEMSVKARKGCRVKDIRLETTFSKDKSKYVMGFGIEGGLRGQDIDWKWDVSDNQDMLWVGGVNGGLRLKWMDENYRRPLINVYYHYGELVEPASWSNGGRGGVTLTERNGDVLLNSYSGERELDAGETLHFNFEILITPFRTVNKEVMFSDRYFHGGGTDERAKVGMAEAAGANIINVHHASDLYPFINYPYLDENLQSLKEIIADAHEHGKRMKFYYTTRELTKNLPEFWAFNSLNGELIFPGPGNDCRTVTNPDGPHQWLTDNVRENYIPAWRSEIDRGIFKGETDLSVITVPDSRLNNFYIGGLDFMVQKMNLDGVYIDDSALDRYTLRRARKVIDTWRPEGRMDFHSWNHLCEPAGNASCLNIYMDLLPYFDLCWIGEGRDYDHPADNWLIEVAGIPFGLPGQMLEGGGNRWRGMLFGITNRAGWGGDELSHIWNFWDQYGIKDMEIIGFWDECCPVKTDNPQVKATLYRGEKRSIIAVAAWGDNDQEVHIDAGLPFSRAFQPEIIGYQPSVENIDLSRNITIPEGKGFVFVLENQGVRNE